MKLGLVIGFVLALTISSDVLAREGRIVLRNQTVACEGISVWNQSSYRITGRCSGLVYPYAERVNGYVLWVRMADGSNVRRIGNINLGYFSDQEREPFDQIFITAEENDSARQPGQVVIASGDLQLFDFGSGSDTPSSTSRLTPAPLPTPDAGTRPLSNFAVGAVRVLLGVVAILIGLGIAVAIVRYFSKK